MTIWRILPRAQEKELKKQRALLQKEQVCVVDFVAACVSVVGGEEVGL